MKGKQAYAESVLMGMLGIFILIVALMLLIKETIGGFTMIIIGITTLGILSFAGWFMLDLMN